MHALQVLPLLAAGPARFGRDRLDELARTRVVQVVAARVRRHRQRLNPGGPMDPQLLFSLTFPLAAPFWALMILAPGWSFTRKVMASPLVAVPPMLVYAALVLPQIGSFLAGVSSPDLPGVMTLLGTPVGAAAGWAHFIAFDLFIGRWMYLDAREHGVHPLVMAPVLVLTILLAPLGLLGYLVLRAVLPARRPVAQAA